MLACTGRLEPFFYLKKEIDREEKMDLTIISLAAAAAAAAVPLSGSGWMI